MAFGDLTTLASVRRYLRGDFSDNTYTMFDAELSRLITTISADVRRQTSRRLDVPAATITERRHGDGKKRLQLLEYPVVSVTSVTVDGNVIPPQTTPTGDGWFLDGDVVELANYAFTEGRGNVSVVYSSGFAAIPSDLEQAVIQLVALAFTDADHVGVSSKTVNGDTANFNGGPQLANAGAIIDRYMRISVA